MSPVRARNMLERADGFGALAANQFFAASWNRNLSIFQWFRRMAVPGSLSCWNVNLGGPIPPLGRAASDIAPFDP